MSCCPSAAVLTLTMMDAATRARLNSENYRRRAAIASRLPFRPERDDLRRHRDAARAIGQTR